MTNINQNTSTQSSERLEFDEARALEYAKGVKDFYSGLIAYVILAVVFFTLRGFNDPILYWVFGGVGLGMIVQGLLAFEVIRLPFQDLERKVAEKKLGRKL